MRSEINRAIDLADELIDQLGNETDNVADFLAGIALAIRRLQGYNDYLLLSLNPSLRKMRTEFADECD